MDLGSSLKLCISSKLPGVREAAGPGTILCIVSPRKCMVLCVAFHCAQLFSLVFKNLKHY